MKKLALKGVVVYTAPSCPWCVKAKKLLRARRIKFREVKLKWSDKKAFAKLKRRTRKNTIPQIFVGKKHIGGYDALARYLKRISAKKNPEGQSSKNVWLWSILAIGLLSALSAAAQPQK